MSEGPTAAGLRGRTLSRRQLLAGLGGVTLAAGCASAFELVQHGVLPGKQALEQLDGSCSVAEPSLEFAPLGPSRSGSFYSRARGCQVGYTLALPPGHRLGDELPLVVMLHGFGGDHTNALSGMSPAQALALQVGGRTLAPMALATVDGGDGYWHPHPADDPLRMVIDELIPICSAHGAGRDGQRIGAMGISMGGYGALILAEHYPTLISAVASISPAIWTNYDEAKSANPTAFTSASDFADYDAVSHAGALRGIPVRVASGYDDPFHPGVLALAQALPPGAVVDFGSGCHTAQFFLQQEPPSLAFLAGHLAR